MRRRGLLAGAALAGAMPVMLPSAEPVPAAAPRGPRFDRPPEPGPLRPPPRPLFSEFRLDNGLRVVLAPRRGLPLVSARLQLELGSLLDPAGKSGLAELCLTLMSKGCLRKSGALDAGDIAFAAESLGASLELDSSPLSGSLSLTLATPALDEGLAMLADLARRPTLPADELERSRARLLDELRLGLADPATLAGWLGRRLFWGAAAAGALSTPASLRRLQREDMLTLHRRQVRPERALLVLAGDIDEARARELAERHFGDWRAPAVPAAQDLPPQRPEPLEARTLLVDLPGAGQSAVLLLAGHAAREDGAARQIGMLANAVLGEGYSARINREVRIRRGLSYSAGSQAESLPGAGMLSAHAQTRHESAAEVAQLMGAALSGLGAAPVPAEELAARRASLLGAWGRQLETTASLAALIGDQLQPGRGVGVHEALAELGQLPETLPTVQITQVQDFARVHWSPAWQRLVVVGDLRAAGAGLRELDAKAWRLRSDELDLDAPLLRRTAPGRGAQ